MEASMLQAASLISRANSTRWSVPQAIQRIAQPLDLSSVSRTRQCVLRGLGHRLNKQKPPTSASAEMGGFGICITYALLASIECYLQKSLLRLLLTMH